MESLDGNAVAGVLRNVFGVEMTDSAGTCGSCGTTAVLGESAAFPGGPGTVIRCCHCDGLLMVITLVRGVHCVDLMGLAALDASA